MSDLVASEAVLIAVVLTDLLLLGTSRLRTCVQMVGIQGVVVGLLPIFLHQADSPTRAWLLAGTAVAIKGIVFPLLLLRVLRQVGIRREVEPFIGTMFSLAAGVGALLGSLWVSSRLALAGASTLMIPAGLATILIGLLVIITRRKAVSQVLGYIVVENGIYIFGVALVGDVPALVELGVLMDAFVAVFLMGIAIHHISREFHHTDVDRLDRMKG